MRFISKKSSTSSSLNSSAELFSPNRRSLFPLRRITSLNCFANFPKSRCEIYCRKKLDSASPKYITKTLSLICCVMCCTFVAEFSRPTGFDSSRRDLCQTRRQGANCVRPSVPYLLDKEIVLPWFLFHCQF